MLIKSVDETRGIHPRTRRFQFLPLFVACVFALTMYPTKADAQIVGDMEANIPFQFHAGNTKLPPGKYVVHVLEGSDLTMMEISNADGSTSACKSLAFHVPTRILFTRSRGAIIRRSPLQSTTQSIIRQ